MSRYIKGYNYSNDFLDGLVHVTAAVETYQLPQTLIADFKSKLSTVGGQAFPAAVELEDSLGQKFDFTSLRGKYVYIDLWASWCVPCIKEIPSLLKLEADTASPAECAVSESDSDSLTMDKLSDYRLNLQMNFHICCDTLSRRDG